MTNIDRVLNWARESSIWSMGFGLACCAIEMMAASACGTTLPDSARRSFAHAATVGPDDRRGNGDEEMAPVLRRLCDQMPIRSG
jgi:NADH:ubiquinone oxidoreductase subunit B-like Fe-S oxidoreductase